ncbi:MAG: VTT domain-containing protein [Candidatus Aenigmatarchaeota archaeon]|nr:VTT domain-containing protein [Candidatus Aenigmarchaeota archaeon]
MIDLSSIFALITSFSISLGYLGAFILGFFSSFTLFIPSPTFIGVFTLAALGTYNPLLLGIFGGLGATIGELIGFVVGVGSKKILIKKYEKELIDIERKFQKYGGFIIIFIFSATPLPFDLVGIFCGSIGYPFKKFFLATFFGKLIKYIFIAYAGFYGMHWLVSYLF